METCQLSVVSRPLLAGCEPSLRTTDHGPRTLRSGISLLEVLISMFVLLFGLMGVAAVFPVGNHYAGRGDQYDRGAAMADAAFADLKARGILQPGAWLYAERWDKGAFAENTWRVTQTGVTAPGHFNMGPGSSMGPGHAFVIDPMGIAAKKAATTRDVG